MKRFNAIKLLTLFFLLSDQLIFAQIPAGGVSLIKETGLNYQKGGAKGILTTISITGQTFTSGFRYATGADISNSWDGQVSFTKIAGIEANDVVLVAFYARATASIQESGDGALIVCIENNTTYEKQIYQKIAIGHEWKQYFVPLQCKSALAMANPGFYTLKVSNKNEVQTFKIIGK